MTDLIYEHPLNEKLRTYLRVEQLITQVQQLSELASDCQQQAFFNSLFALIEVLDRNDIRPDLIKDCERIESSLVTWANHPSVSDEKLKPVLQQAVRLQTELLRHGKFAAQLKDDKFLSPLRQRFAIPGGTCFFDVPQLQFWFNLPLEQRQQAVQNWFTDFQLVQQALGFALRFCREKGQFNDLTAEHGFYQSNTEQFELLRIRYNTDSGVYPTVSGNKYRFAIRFMQLCDETGRNNCEKDVSFALACC